MPFKTPEQGLRRIRRQLASVADPNGAGRSGLIDAVGTAVRGLLAEQFEKGIGPDGKPYKLTVRNRPALISRKLPAAFASRTDRGILRVKSETTRDMLVAHQFGHVFPKRSVAAHKQYLSFNSKGRLVRGTRIFRKAGDLRRGTYQRFAAAHDIRQRVLAARQIYPEGTMPLRWEEAIYRGLQQQMRRWAAETEGTRASV